MNKIQEEDVDAMKGKMKHKISKACIMVINEVHLLAWSYTVLGWEIIVPTNE